MLPNFSATSDIRIFFPSISKSSSLSPCILILGRADFILGNFKLHKSGKFGSLFEKKFAVIGFLKKNDNDTSH